MMFRRSSTSPLSNNHRDSDSLETKCFIIAPDSRFAITLVLSAWATESKCFVLENYIPAVLPSLFFDRRFAIITLFGGTLPPSVIHHNPVVIEFRSAVQPNSIILDIQRNPVVNEFGSAARERGAGLAESIIHRT